MTGVAFGLLAWLLGAPPHPSPVEPPGVVWIPGSWFQRGSGADDVADAVALCARGLPRDVARLRCAPPAFEVEMPARRVWVSSFGIDRTEVTLGAWRRCVLAGRCPPARMPADDPRTSTPAHPVGGVTWGEARRFCRWVGGRLPTEAEWERAARGVSPRRRWPWGRFWNPRLANHGGGLRESGVDGFRHAAPVGSFPDGASPHGLLDAAGNVWEWTADRFAPDAYAGIDVDPRGPQGGGERVVRGGSWLSPPVRLRVTARRGLPEGVSRIDVGLRCAYDSSLARSPGDPR